MFHLRVELLLFSNMGLRCLPLSVLFSLRTFQYMVIGRNQCRFNQVLFSAFGCSYCFYSNTFWFCVTTFWS